MCRADDFPPYADEPYPADGEPTTPTEYNGWRNRATWSAWNWLSGGDEMLFRLARARVRSAGSDYETVGRIGRELLRESGGPLAARELELAGGLEAVDLLEIGAALVELFDGDDRL